MSSLAVPHDEKIELSQVKKTYLICFVIPTLKNMVIK